MSRGACVDMDRVRPASAAPLVPPIKLQGGGGAMARVENAKYRAKALDVQVHEDGAQTERSEVGVAVSVGELRGDDSTRMSEAESVTEAEPAVEADPVASPRTGAPRSPLASPDQPRHLTPGCFTARAAGLGRFAFRLADPQRHLMRGRLTPRLMHAQKQKSEDERRSSDRQAEDRKRTRSLLVKSG